MTDLLDGWEDGSVELPPPAGMSPERIKERTMEQIRQTKRPRRRMGVRLLACAALAAVFTVSAMAAYHLWGPGELFDPFFTLESAPLDDGQKELLDQIGATNLPPVTSNGVTLTPLAAIADEHTLYLRLRLEAPEGTVLPDMGEQEDHIAHGVGLVDADTGERLNWGMQKARFLPDDTPGDNSLELVFMLLGGPNGANWVDGTSKTLTITDLILCPPGAGGLAGAGARPAARPGGGRGAGRAGGADPGAAERTSAPGSGHLPAPLLLRPDRRRHRSGPGHAAVHGEGAPAPGAEEAEGAADGKGVFLCLCG